MLQAHPPLKNNKSLFKLTIQECLNEQVKSMQDDLHPFSWLHTNQTGDIVELGMWDSGSLWLIVIPSYEQVEFVMCDGYAGGCSDPFVIKHEGPAQAPNRK